MTKLDVFGRIKRAKNEARILLCYNYGIQFTCQVIIGNPVYSRSRSGNRRESGKPTSLLFSLCILMGDSRHSLFIVKIKESPLENGKAFFISQESASCGIKNMLQDRPSLADVGFSVFREKRKGDPGLRIKREIKKERK